jgi:hypothetical protein
MRNYLQTKNFLLIFLLLLVITASGFAQVTPVWQKSVAASNLPLWFGADTERGLAYGMVGGNERVYVVSRKTTIPQIIILNAATGDSVGVLDVTGVTGGLYPLNDVEVSDDGVIYACNMTTGAATAAFKIYKWTSEAAAPVEVINYAIGAVRLGDKFTVVGSAGDNSLTIYAAVGSAATVIRFTTTDGIVFTPVTLTATGVSGSTPAVDAVGPGEAGFFVNANSIAPKEYTAAATLVGTVLADFAPSGSNAIRYFAYGGRKYIATYLYGTGLNLARVVDITSGIGNTANKLSGITPSLGSAANSNGTGDLDIKNNGDGTYTIYVLASNNGIGAYVFNPAVNPIALPYLENFEGTIPPPGYVRANGFMNMPLITSSTSWVSDDFANITTPVNKSIRNNIFGTTRKDWVVTPSFDLGDGSVDYQMEFDLALTKYAATTADTLGIDDTLAVLISTDDGLTWSSANVLKLWTAENLISNTGEHHVFNLSSYSGKVKFGFYGASSVSNKDNDIFVDNIQVREIPSLPIISVNPVSHNYGGLQTGTSASKNFIISNTGVGTLTISSAVLSDGISYAKVDTAAYPVTLGNLQSYSLTVNFTPASIGTHNDTLRITSNLGVFDVPLTGTGFDASVSTFPYMESFDNETFPALGWLNVQLNGTGLFKRVTAGTSPAVTPYAGAAMIQWNSYSYLNGVSAALITPKIVFPSEGYLVKFWMYRDGGYLTNVDRITVYLNSTPSITGADSIGGVYRSKNLYPVVAADGWYEYSFILPGPLTGDKFILLVGTSAYGNNTYIDEFSIEKLPDLDYKVTSLIQINGIPSPFRAPVNDNYMIKGKEQLSFNPFNQQSAIRDPHANNSEYLFIKREESGFALGNSMLVYPPASEITLRTMVANVGTTSPAYDLNWSVGGQAGTPVARPGIAMGSVDTVLIETIPLFRGTLTSIVDAVVPGDTFPNNTAAFHRTLVYPDSSIRIKYDNGLNVPNTFIGFASDTVNTFAAVRFTAAQDMQLSNIDAYYRNEASTDSVEVRVYAAGATINAPGALLYSKKFGGVNYLSVNGDYYTLPLGTDAPAFLSGSDYWVALKFTGVPYPMGAHNSPLTTPGHSYVSSDESAWFALFVGDPATERAWVLRVVGVSYVVPPPPPVFTVFERSQATGTLPTWFGAGTERGIAWGNVSDGRAQVSRLFVPSRNGGTKVKVMDDSTGVDLGELLTTDISGGTYAVNDVEVTADGKIFVCNLTTNSSTSAFKVYMWSSLTSAPAVVVNFTSTDADRLGDNFTVVGDYSAGTAVIYAAHAGAAAGRIYKWTMTGGAFNAVPEIITLSDNVAGSAASVAPTPDGSFYFNAIGITPKKYSSTGTLLGTVPSGVVPTGSGAIKYIGTVDTLDYFVTFQYNTAVGNIFAYGKIVAVPVGNVAGAFVFGQTPSLGNVSTTGVGDVAARVNADGTANVYVLGHSNGFGAYRTNYVIPVELTSFAADVNDRSVILNWSTATEVNTSLFQVERTETDNLNWSAVADVKAFGTTTEKKDYSFTDKNLNSGKYLYRLRIVDFDGSYEYSPAVEAEIGVPVEFSMSQNYPNPFNPSTRINYQVPVDANVTIELFDVTGQKVATFVNQDLKAGYHTLEVSGLRLASGMYIYRMIAVSAETGRNFMDVKKMMMLK